MNAFVKTVRLTCLQMIPGLVLFLSSGLVAFAGIRTRGRDVQQCSQPPGSIEICDTLNRLWEAKEYEQADAYVRELHASWSNYIPVELTWAIHARRFGVRMDEYVERGRALEQVLKRDIELESPVFLGELASCIMRTESIMGPSEKESSTHSKEQSDSIRSFKPSSTPRWTLYDDWLYALVPEVSTGENAEWRSADAPVSNDKFRDVPEKQLHWILGTQVPLAEKKASCRELVRRLEEEGGAERVVREFLGASVLYTYPDLVDSLMTAPDEAVPALVAFMETPIDRYNPTLERKMAIWALVRIGRADAEVMRVLEECRAAHPDDELGDYAARAAEYLAKRSAP